MAPPPPPPPPAPPPPPLMDELVEECLLRLPPDDPASLVRAALVCKRWHRIIADSGFGRRFRRLHRRPPMLGFFQKHTRKELCFTATSFFRPCNADLDVRFRSRRGHVLAIDSRHGLVLSTRPFLSNPLHLKSLTAWDPITSDQLDLPDLPSPQHPRRFGRNSRAVVLCASTACDHLDCHRGHFLVVFMDTSTHVVCTYVYSSEAGTWSHSRTVAQDLSDTSRLLHRQPVAMAGNALYFGVHRRITTEMPRYDLGTNEVSWISLPPGCCSRGYQILLTTTEYGGLGIARVKGSRIHIWSRDAGPNEVLGWTPSATIELETVLPANSGAISTVVFVHDLGAFFISTNAGAFTVDLVSNLVKKVSGNSRVSCFVPYTSFFNPALGAAFTEEEPTAGVPSA